MKKINSIDYGAKVIGIGLIFLAVIEIGFGCHLAIELRQDKLIDRYYSEHPSSTKTPQEILNERHRG